MKNLAGEEASGGERNAKWKTVNWHIKAGEIEKAYSLAEELNQELVAAPPKEFPPLYEETLSMLALWKRAQRGNAHEP